MQGIFYTLSREKYRNRKMEKVTIWYFTDNDSGKKVARAIENMGLLSHCLEGMKIDEININQEEINIFIFDQEKMPAADVVALLEKDGRVQSALKFLVAAKKEIKGMAEVSYNLLHLEFVSRPVNVSEFLLLLEKSIIVERYREIMKFISKEAETRIETYEGMMDINRKNIFSSEKEKETFEQILSYEKNLIREQSRLNKAIRDFTIMRHEELFDMRSRIKAEEMLSDLRRREMLEAKETINAQESVIDYSSLRLKEVKDILDASEKVAELGRSEQINLNEDNRKLQEMNKTLANEMERLLMENQQLQKLLKSK